MSSLPPYNPRLGDHAVWLFPALTAADLPVELPWGDGPWGAAAVDNEALATEVRARYRGIEVKVVAQPGEVAVPGASWLLLAGHPAWCEVLLRRLMGMPDGTAIFRLVPGAISTVELLPDRAVLVRLNDGRALD